MRKYFLWLATLWLWNGSLAAGSWEWQGESSVVWHDNVTNADRPTDRLAALQWRGGLAAATGWALPARQRVAVTWRLEAAHWPRYGGLDEITSGAEVSWSRKLGLGPQAPLITGSVDLAGLVARETARSGHGGKLAVGWRQRLGPAWLLAASTEWEDFRAHGHAFNRTGRQHELRAEYRPGPEWQFALELRSRHGVVLNYTAPPRLDLVQAGHVLTLVDTFGRTNPRLAYYFPADTLSGAAELTRVLSPRTALQLRWEYRDTTHNVVNYLNQRLTAELSHRF